MRNLLEFLELPARDLDAGETWTGPIERIEVEDAGFRYPLTDVDVLRGVTFSVRRGESLALVGVNGAGKSTLIKLLTRLYESTRGRTLLNGPDAARFSPRSVQRESATGFRDFGQYQMTVRENVAVGRGHGDAEEGALHAAAARAGAAAFVGELPQGGRANARPLVRWRAAALGGPVATPGARAPVLPGRLGPRVRRAGRGPPRQRRVRGGRGAALAGSRPHHHHRRAPRQHGAHGGPDRGARGRGDPRTGVPGRACRAGRHLRDAATSSRRAATRTTRPRDGTVH